MNVFQIDDWIFNFTEHTILHKDEIIRLQFRESNILLFFIQNEQKVVSRDALINHAWQGRAIDDNTINSAISKIRNHLPKPEKYIKTISKQGYCFTANAIVLITDPTKLKNHTQNNNKTKTTSTKKAEPSFVIKAAIASVCLLIVSLTLSYFLQSSTVSTSIITEQTKTDVNIIYENGFASRGEYSPNNELLAYTIQNSLSEKPVLKIKNMDTAISHKVRNSEGAMAFYWHSNSEIYLQLIVDNSCEIHRFTRLDNTPFNIDPSFKLNCGLYTTYAGIDGDNDEWLYYSSKTLPSSPFSLYRYNLKNSFVEQLTTPSYSSGGDYSVKLSPNNNLLTFARSNSANSKSIGVLNINSREVEFLAHTKTPIYGVFWSDDEHLLYADKKLLKRISVESKVQTTIYKSDSTIRLPVLKNGELLASKGPLFTTNIRTHKINSRNFDYLSNTAFRNSRGAFHPDSKSEETAFITDQSGLPQLWIQRGDKFIKQITSFTDRYSLTELRYSPDGQVISFLKNGTINLYSINDNKLKSLDDRLVNSTSWDCSTGKLLSVIKNKSLDKWDLYEVDRNLSINYLTDNISTVKHDCSSLNSFVSLPHTPGIYQLNKSTLTTELVYKTDIYFTRSEAWGVFKEDLFINKERKLFKYNFNTELYSELTMSGLTSAGFSISQGYLIYPERKLGNTTISKLAI